MIDLERALTTLLDHVVVGTGIGGATLGHALAVAGQRVLFLERGRAHFRHPDALRGQYSEMVSPSTARVSQQKGMQLLLAGRYPDAISDSGHPFTPMIGCGSGGSSALYGMTMERFFPADFVPGLGAHTDPRKAHPPWPISYADLAP